MNSKRFSAIMEQSEVKESDHSAADYLKVNRGMNLASDDINSFQFRMDEIVMKGAIGTGSYGEVYRAAVRGKVVAVKKLHVRNLRAEQIDSFCQEASLMCQLNHPNIVGFIGAVTEPSNLCILTQYCNRGSLADILLENTVDMNFHMKLQCALDAANGMLYLHNSNPVILHRDLKSDNLLVTNDWTVKVADFGLTRFISEKKQMTQVGTPHVDGARDHHGPQVHREGRRVRVRHHTVGDTHTRGAVRGEGAHADRGGGGERGACDRPYDPSCSTRRSCHS